MIKVSGPVYRARESDAGFDLICHAYHLIQPGELVVLKTGVRLELPNGVEAQVRGRSGNSVNGLWVALGTIDSGYRGEIGVIACNMGKTVWMVTPGDRIAQLVFARYESQVEIVDSVGMDTDRGESGFGSSGK